MLYPEERGLTRMDNKEKTPSSPGGHPIGDENETDIHPLLVGRVLRVLAGAGTLWLALNMGIDQLSLWGFVPLMFLGVSFLVSGIMAMPGCEIYAIPNLFLPRARRLHFGCPVWTPLDKAEHRIRSKRRS